MFGFDNINIVVEGILKVFFFAGTAEQSLKRFSSKALELNFSFYLNCKLVCSDYF